MALDHGMASQSWLSIFSNSIVYSIEASESDHLPIFLDPRQLPRRNRHQRFDLKICGCENLNVV